MSQPCSHSKRMTPAGDDFLCSPPSFCSGNSREAVLYRRYEADEERAPSLTCCVLLSIVGDQTLGV